MKKLIIAILVTMLTLSVSITAGCGKKDPNTIYVGILQVATHTALDNARNGFEDTLNAWAKNNGKKVEYKSENANGDNNNERTIAQNLASRKPDILLGIGTSSARELGNSTSTIPVLYTAVTDPQGEDFVRSNMTGTSDINPVAEQIMLIKKLVPDCKKIGFLFNSSETNSNVQYELAKAQCDKMTGVELVKITATASSDIQTAIEGYVSKVDAVYVPTDNLMADNMKLICSTLYGAHIPVVSGETGMCEDEEGVATLGVDYYKLGVQTAKIAIRILSGEKTAGEIPFEVYSEEATFYINENNAKMAGVSDDIVKSVIKEYTK